MTTNTTTAADLAAKKQDFYANLDVREACAGMRKIRERIIEFADFYVYRYYPNTYELLHKIIHYYYDRYQLPESAESLVNDVMKAVDYIGSASAWKLNRAKYMSEYAGHEKGIEGGIAELRDFFEDVVEDTMALIGCDIRGLDLGDWDEGDARAQWEDALLKDMLYPIM